MRILLILIISLNVPNIWASSVREISLEEVIRLAEMNSPRLSAAKLREIAAEKGIDIAKSNYFPTINAESIYSQGFPGSSGLTGVGGLMGSPYRSGVGAGFVAKQTIWDFGRTFHAVKASKYETELSEQETKVTLYEIKQLALKKFYECAFFKTQRELWTYLEGESGIITKEVESFVNTGQRSIVERYLSKAQTEEATSYKVFFAERLKQSINELSVIMGVSEDNFSCPALPNKISHSLHENNGIESSPLFTRALANARVAEEKLKQEKAGYYPEITAVASTGYMQRSRLVQRQNYAVGVGISLPLFDLNTRGKVDRAEVIASEKNKEIESERQYLEEINAKFDETIKSSQVLLNHLDEELKIANEAFDLAKKRYFSLEGTLIDLRESFRNLSRVRVEIENTRANLLQASGAKVLLNGG